MSLVRKIGLIVAALLVIGSMASPVLAAGENPFASPAWGAGLGAGLVIIGAALGFGKIGAAALESMARQPETAGRVQTAMIIIGALLEGVAFFALVICFLIGQKVV